MEQSSTADPELAARKGRAEGQGKGSSQSHEGGTTSQKAHSAKCQKAFRRRARADRDGAKGAGRGCKTSCGRGGFRRSKSEWIGERTATKDCPQAEGFRSREVSLLLRKQHANGIVL